MFKDIFSFFSQDIGIDLGTANTLVYVKGKGIVINEPSVVAINKKTSQAVAVGLEAKKMVGKTPGHIQAIRPLIDGVISDFEVTEEMLAYFIRRVQEDASRFFARSRIVIGVPSGITNVEIRAVHDAALSAGAKETYVVEEPMAAAIGAGLPIFDPVGSMVIDMGGGTTDIAVISLGGIVTSRNLRIAGDKLNEDIINYARDEFKVLLGENTAEHIKISIGSVSPKGEGLEITIRGRDLVSGLPREVTMTDVDVRDAIMHSVGSIISTAKEVIEETPPELVSDIMRSGIVLVGGGSFLRNLAPFLTNETKIPVRNVEDPLTTVVRGTGVILEDISAYRDILIRHDEEATLQ